MATATEFVRQNDRSLVVESAVIGRGGQGADYRFEDRTEMRLSAAQLRELPAGYPRWARRR